jgi:hypothetical protein
MTQAFCLRAELSDKPHASDSKAGMDGYPEAGLIAAFQEPTIQQLIAVSNYSRPFCLTASLSSFGRGNLVNEAVTTV